MEHKKNNHTQGSGASGSGVVPKVQHRSRQWMGISEYAQIPNRFERCPRTKGQAFWKLTSSMYLRMLRSTTILSDSHHSGLYRYRRLPSGVRSALLKMINHYDILVKNIHKQGTCWTNGAGRKRYLRGTGSLNSLWRTENCFRVEFSLTGYGLWQIG